MQGVGAQHHCATEARHEMLQVATYANCLLAVAYVQSGREDERWKWRSLLLYAAWHVWVEEAGAAGVLAGADSSSAQYNASFLLFVGEQQQQAQQQRGRETGN